MPRLIAQRVFAKLVALIFPPYLAAEGFALFKSITSSNSRCRTCQQLQGQMTSPSFVQTVTQLSTPTPSEHCRSNFFAVNGQVKESPNSTAESDAQERLARLAVNVKRQ